jgi:hypothetical protein
VIQLVTRRLVAVLTSPSTEFRHVKRRYYNGVSNGCDSQKTTAASQPGREHRDFDGPSCGSLWFLAGRGNNGGIFEVVENLARLAHLVELHSRMDSEDVRAVISAED